MGPSVCIASNTRRWQNDDPAPCAGRVVPGVGRFVFVVLAPTDRTETSSSLGYAADPVGAVGRGVRLELVTPADGIAGTMLLAARPELWCRQAPGSEPAEGGRVASPFPLRWTAIPERIQS